MSKVFKSLSEKLTVDLQKKHYFFRRLPIFSLIYLSVLEITFPLIVGMFTKI